MDMPPIHMCAFLSHENERLKTKITNLKRHIARLEGIIAERDLDHVHSCSISCQTDINIPRPVNPIGRPSTDEQLRLRRLLKEQNDLLKKYEDDAVRDRKKTPSPTIINDYERRLIQCEEEKQQAERQAMYAQERLKKLEDRYERIKRELSVFDENFFEELEDLKYALQRANDLNREYEKTVQMLSNRLGIPYPTITTTTTPHKRK